MRAVVWGALPGLLSLTACMSAVSERAAAITWADEPDDVAGCEHLGVVAGSAPAVGPSPTDEMEASARNAALEEAARQGATHVLWRPSTYGTHMQVTGDAYVCGPRDPDQALAEAASLEPRPLDQRCEDGEAASCFALGKIYVRGTARPKDVARGLGYLEQACGKRIVDACLEGGSVLAGSESAEERSRAGRFYRAACKLGHQQACSLDGSVAHDARPGEDQLLGLGTCFAISEDGLIATADHVVAGARSIAVQFDGEEAIPAKVEKQTSAIDVAVLRVERKATTFVPVVADPMTGIGDRVFTIGFPQPGALGFEAKFSEGTISSISAGGEDHLMQMSLPIHQGNSGGAVVSEEGVLVGIVVARIDDRKFIEHTGAIAGDISFAVKSEYVSGIVPREARAAKATPLPRKQAIALVQGATCKVLTIKDR